MNAPRKIRGSTAWSCRHQPDCEMFGRFMLANCTKQLLCVQGDMSIHVPSGLRGTSRASEAVTVAVWH